MPMRWLFALALLLIPSFAAAEPDGFDYETFGRIPVLHEGRIKPLASLARAMLPHVYGQRHYKGMSDPEWLAFLFFSRTEAMRAPMMTVHSPQAARMLGLLPHPDGRYSFEEIAAVLSPHAGFIRDVMGKEKKSITADEAEIVRIYAAANDFAELTGTFSLVLPLEGMDDTLRAEWGFEGGAGVTYFDLLGKRQLLEDELRKIMARKTPGDYTRREQAVARIAARMMLQEKLDGDNTLVRVMPPGWGGEEWLSPWGVLAASSGSPASAALLRDWRMLAESYRLRDGRGWNETAHRLLGVTLAAVTPATAIRLELESYYNLFEPLMLAAGCYVLGMALSPGGVRFRQAGYGALLAGLVLHGTALVLRMAILMRPPVSTLYESLIFVSFLTMAASARLGRGSRLALMTGAATGLALLLVSNVFAEGETLGVLVAVLNTNFWLATHVVCITTGYACALVTGALAHLYLFRRAVIGVSEASLSSLAALLHRAALVALFFTAVGTMLGGIWADQSWGRFWGWDPKENGALMIVLWLIWGLHGRVAGQLRSVGFAVAMALLNIIVAGAWIGVNLLGIGLHSYGFTDAAARGLLAFWAVELAFVACMTLLLRFPQAFFPGRPAPPGSRGL